MLAAPWLPYDIVIEHLRAIRADITDLRGDDGLKNGIISVRDDIHALRGDIRRQERAFASVEVDINRIKARLNLSDA